MKHFIFNFTHQSTTYTVIFDYTLVFNDVELREEVLNFHRSNAICRKLIYISPEHPLMDLNALTSSLVGIFNAKRNDITLFSYTEFGVDTLDKRSRVKLLEALIDHGLCQIVEKRGAIVHGDEMFHFVLPSQKHSSFFIRTGNILQFNNEINFIAFCLLQKLGGSLFNYIACDTSSIIPIGYAYQYLLSLFNVPPVPIYSFRSYQGIDTFEPRPSTLILISATNSGDLEKRILSTISERDVEIVTVISNMSQPNGRHLVNINSLISKSEIGLTRILRSDPSDECKLCSLNSIPVLIRGDQFMPSRVITQKILIYRRHIPIWIKETFEYLCCSDAISCFRSEDLASKRREIFIDFEKLLNGETKQSNNFKKLVSRTINNLVPASVGIILHLKERSSELLAQLVHAHFSKGGEDNIRILPHTKIRDIEANDLSSDQSILVISAFTASGNKLNSVSRNLRVFKKSSIHYITMVARLESSNSLDILKSNLSYRGNKTECLNIFTSVLDSYLGDHHTRRRSAFKKPSWQAEIDFLSENSNKLPDSVRKRLDKLSQNSGLINDLFYWNPRTRQPLILRDNFALYDFNDITKVSQADVYFVVAACFHALRNPGIKTSRIENKDKYLIQHEHVKSIIDPRTFNRYNDGILQACILRIAHPIELSYNSEESSAAISRVLIDLFKGSDSNDSEAVLEFLFALACKKMTLLPQHLKSVCDTIESEFKDIEEVAFFLSVIRSSKGT